MLIYVYQEPQVAWRFTKIREHNHRDCAVPKNVFVEACLNSKRNYLQALLDGNIRSHTTFVVFRKDYGNNLHDIVTGDDVDNFVKLMYNDINLNKVVGGC